MKLAGLIIEIILHATFFAGIILYCITSLLNTVKAEKLRDILTVSGFLLFVFSFINISIFFREFSVDLVRFKWVLVFYVLYFVLFSVFDIIHNQKFKKLYDKYDKKVWWKHYRNRPITISILIFFPLVSLTFLIAVLNIFF